MAAGDLIPRRLRQRLEDGLTANAAVSGLEGCFENADIPYAEGLTTRAGARPVTVRGTYAALDPASRRDQRRFLNVLAPVLDRAEELHAIPYRGAAASDAPDPLAALHKELAKRGDARADGKILATSVTARLDDAKATPGLRPGPSWRAYPPD